MAPKLLAIPGQDAIRVKAEAIRCQVAAMLQAVNVPERDAQITAEILTAASLRGVDSHRVGNVTGYVQSIENGVYTMPQTVEIVTESATTALLDCGNGLGFVAAHRVRKGQGRLSSVNVGSDGRRPDQLGFPTMNHCSIS